MTDLHYLSLSDITRRAKSGELRAVQVVEHMLSRIEALEPETRAYQMVLGERALGRAEELDGRRSQGEPLGPLHGAPIALKDLLFTKGLPTSSGTKVMADWCPDYDATVVERLEAAGAVVLGKVKLTEGAYGEHHPDVVPPRNPWNPEHWTGVSSSGSGVAVAAGLAHGAIGTDTGGSIRFPSAACGLVGIKPTYGRVSRYGVFPLAESLDHIGPMTRSVEDAARMLQAMAGHDPNDSTSLEAPVPPYPTLRRQDLAGATIGVDWRYVSEGVDEPVTAVIQAATALVRDLGGVVKEVAIPPLNDLARNWAITCGVECARAHAEWYPSRADDYGPALKGLIELGRRSTADAYEALQRQRAAFREGLDAMLAEVDALIAPCMTTPTPRVDADGRIPRGDSTETENRAEFISFTAPFDYSGHPSITLPLRLSSGGLPESFQLIGPHLGEGRLIELATALETAAGFVCEPPSTP